MVVFGVIAFVADEAVLGAISMTAAVVAAAVWWVWSTLRFRAVSWELTEGTVESRLGVVRRVESVLPRGRVQNVTKSSGPVERALGMATIHVHSAGANTPDIVIPHVYEADAEHLRSVLLPREQTEGSAPSAVPESQPDVDADV